MQGRIGVGGYICAHTPSVIPGTAAVVRDRQMDGNSGSIIMYTTQQYGNVRHSGIPVHLARSVAHIDCARLSMLAEMCLAQPRACNAACIIMPSKPKLAVKSLLST
jgi:hypothetical protein